ncbi:nucleic acid-binding protein [Halobellus sp. H-GB7]|uniref:nucleic acid-binding protein n=1 Tax=Halobellus sp. H-GB7 TaxID=3069756 RepID=UPI0027B6ED82|nr:nucleic acid-binding protein [Halobellus sp. H-GB7]MDQ2055188.1 nucleic acid-binding protein [Halobellus sp. H-GB7]
MIVAVADTGPLIHLEEADALDLLSTVDELFIPQTVYDELEVGDDPPTLSSIAHEIVRARQSLTQADHSLDPGETAALNVAIERDAVLLTDDLEARNVAEDENVEVHGSIGVIALGCARGRSSKQEAADLMRALQRETSLFVTDAVVERGISLLQTEDH